MRIALDAMGGDYAPGPIVGGAIQALQQNADMHVVLVGDQAQIDQCKTTYAQKCSHCHGPNMVNSGTITPDLRRFPDDRTRFVTTVKQGKNGKMPPWGDILSDGEIGDIWAYVTSRRNP